MNNLYVDHPTGQANFYSVTVGDLTVWFSYKTPIAFRLFPDEPTVRENDWSNTTGKHLNYIDDGDKSSRIPGDDFEAKLDRLIGLSSFPTSPVS